MSTTIYSTTDQRGEPVSLHHHTEYRGDFYSVSSVNEHREYEVRPLMKWNEAMDTVVRLTGKDAA